MTMDIFHRLRQAFGNEECEFCGRLYYSRNDCQQHVKTHTGNGFYFEFKDPGFGHNAA